MHDTFRAAAIPVGARADAGHRADPPAAAGLARRAGRRRRSSAVLAIALHVARAGAEGPRQLEPGAVLRRCCWAPACCCRCRSAFAFGLATLAYLATLTHTPLTVVVSRMDEGMSSLILLAVPLFVFLGLLIEMTGMARAMVGVPGGAARPCARRAVLRAAGRDVSGVRHLRLEGRRHGGGGAGAVPGDEAAAAPTRASWCRCSPHPAR